MKKTAIILIALAFIAGSCAQTPKANRLLDDKIVQNYSNNCTEISNKFTQVCFDNEKKQFIENDYLIEIRKFEHEINAYLFYDDYSVNYFTDMYIGLLEINIPDIFKNIYLEYGLGNQGHKAYMAIFLGTFILQTENRINSGYYFYRNKSVLKHKLNSLKNVIHKKDLKIIQKNLDNLPIAVD